jgi:hypothetical protein
MHKAYVGLFALLGAASAGAMPSYPTPGATNPESYSFIAGHSGTVTAYFAGQTASYTNVLGLMVNGVDTGIVGLNNHAAALGEALNFGHVSAGDTLTFYINVLTTGNTFYSDASMNSDGLQHIWSTPYAGGDYGIPAGTYVGFEDIAWGGDKDYDDLQFVWTNAVPEPSAWALMIAGFGLVGTALRRRRAAIA